ncbi:MAG: hypothetical protein IPH30_18190 [Betaproteobacteria bacterium]|nr:hypothetical protein [Betaproteobacteria bacterium]
MGDAFLNERAVSRLAPVSALLLGVVWIAEIARIFHPAPALAAIGAACLAAYALTAWTRASTHIRVLFGLTVAVSVAIAWTQGSAAALQAGFDKAQIFGAFLPSVLMLRATVAASPRIERLRGDLGRLGHEAAQNWTQYGSHGLGAVLNVGAMAILAPVVTRDADRSRLADLARSSARGVGGAVMWSPFFSPSPSRASWFRRRRCGSRWQSAPGWPPSDSPFPMRSSRRRWGGRVSGEASPGWDPWSGPCCS